MNEQIAKLQHELGELGIVGGLAADLDQIETCVEIAHLCQVRIQKLMELGVTTNDRGQPLSDIYKQGERILRKYANREDIEAETAKRCEKDEPNR